MFTFLGVGTPHEGVLSFDSGSALEELWISSYWIAMASSCQLEFGLMIGPFVVTEPKRLLLAQQHLGSIIDAKHYFVFIQVASTLAHGPEHRLSFDLALPYFSLLSRDFLRSVVLIHHMLHMLEQLFLDSGSGIRQKVSRLGLDSSILVPFYLFDSSFLLLYMDIWRIGALLVYLYMVFTPLAGVKSF